MAQPHPYARHVARFLEQDGFVAVELEREVKKALWRTNGRRTIPFDISYLVPAVPPVREYVECKQRNTYASERDVAKFIADLKVCDIPLANGLVVTDNGYQPLAIDYARREGVRLYVLPMVTNASLVERVSTSIIGRMRNTVDLLKTGVRLPNEFRRIV